MIILFILLTMYLTVLSLYKLYQKDGLIYSFIILLNICYIFLFKNISFYNFNLNLGCLYLPTTFIIYYFLQMKNDNNTIKVVKYSIISILITLLLVLSSCLFDYSILDNYGIEYNNVFITNSNILIIYPLYIIILEYFFIKIYSYLDSLYKNKVIKLLLSNVIFCILSSIILILLTNYNHFNISIIILTLDTCLMSLILSSFTVFVLNYLILKKVLK